MDTIDYDNIRTEIAGYLALPNLKNLYITCRGLYRTLGHDEIMWRQRTRRDLWNMDCTGSWRELYRDTHSRFEWYNVDDLLNIERTGVGREIVKLCLTHNEEDYMGITQNGDMVHYIPDGPYPSKRLMATDYTLGPTEPMVDASATYDESYGLDRNGSVWSLNGEDHTRVALSIVHISTPRALCVDTDGRVWKIREDQSLKLWDRLIDHKIIRIACGIGFTAFIDSEYRLWIHSTKWSTIGMGMPISPDNTSRCIDLPSKVIDVACGEFHISVLCEDHTVWTAGSNVGGQLGIPREYVHKDSRFYKMMENGWVIGCCDDMTAVIDLDRNLWCTTRDWRYDGTIQRMEGVKADRLSCTYSNVLFRGIVPE